MKRYKWIIIGVNLLLLLVYLNYAVFSKEKILNGGQLILLELAPADPRSLMQGDYMNLRYTISQEVDFEKTQKRGYCVVRLQSDGVAVRQRFQQDNIPLAADEHLIRYTMGDWSINIGAESYFFQEGQAEKYAKAKYGGIKTDKEGNSVLVGLYDEDRKRIE